MTFNGGTVAKLALLVVGGVLLQVTAISQLTILGASADLSPLIVVTIGMLAGAEYGAVLGFAVGFMVDMTLLQTLGFSSLIYTPIGYVAGRYGELRDPTATLVPLGAGAAATLAATVGYTAVQVMLGVDSPVSALLIREIAVTVALNTLLAVPVFLGIRRFLSPALREEVLPRRPRRARTGMIQLS